MIGSFLTSPDFRQWPWLTDDSFRQSLSPEEAQELLGRLIDHYVFLVNGGERPLVIRKLASSLATIFLKPNAPWSRALCNLAASLADGKHVSEEYCKSIDLRNAVLPAMSERHVTSLLYFSNILAEEIHRWSSEPRRSREEHHTYVNVKDAFSVVDYVLSHIMRQHASGIPASDEALGTEAINSYQVGFVFQTLLASQLHLISDYIPGVDECTERNPIA